MDKKRTYRCIISCLVLLCAMLLLSFLLLSLLSFLVWKMDGNVRLVSGGLIAVYIISNVFGGYMAGRIFGRQKFFWGMLIGICFFCILLLSGIFLSGGVRDDSRIFSGLMICMVSGMAGGMLSPGKMKNT